MSSSLNPAIKSLDGALTRLEKAVEKKLVLVKKHSIEPQLDLSARNEKDVNRKIANKLDQTINHLETLLSGE